MTDLIPVDNTPGAPSGVKSPRNVPKRKLAKSLTAALRKSTYVASVGKKMSKQAFLATVLSDLVTTGHAILADGSEITVTDFGDWFQMVKFLHTHIDGPTTNEAGQVNNVAIYKVYAGVDVDKV